MQCFFTHTTFSRKYYNLVCTDGETEARGRVSSKVPAPATAMIMGQNPVIRSLSPDQYPCSCSPKFMKFEVTASISYWGMTPEEDWVLASEGWLCALEGEQPPQLKSYRIVWHGNRCSRWHCCCWHGVSGALEGETPPCYSAVLCFWFIDPSKAQVKGIHFIYGMW